jgi:hypothetical protein
MSEASRPKFDAWNTPWGNITWDGENPFSQEEIDSWNAMTDEELRRLTETSAEREARGGKKAG